MTTLPALRAQVRRDLHDEDPAAYRWPDATLDRHIGRAVRELSLRIPRERKSILTTTPGLRQISLTPLTGWLEVVAVEWPAGLWPAAYEPYSIFEDALTLQGPTVPAAAENIVIYWHGPHTLDASSSTLPVWGEDLVASGAAGYAALEQTFHTTGRINAAGRTVTLDFAKLAQDRLGHFEAELRRLGAQSRVRQLWMNSV